MKITRRLVLAGSGAAAAAAKARARSLNVGGGSAFTPPPPPTIVSITISNASFLQNTGNAVVGLVKVVMSDQSIFNGIISLVFRFIQRIHRHLRRCDTRPWRGGMGPWHSKYVWY